MRALRFIALVSLIGLFGVALLCAADAQTFKSAVGQGLDLYHKEKLAQAEAQFLQAEKLARNDIERAKARYHLGLVYYKQRQWDRALSALEAAQKLDPQIGFTNDKEQFREKLSTARANVSVSTSKSGSAPQAPQASDPTKAAIVKALISAERGGLWDFADLLAKDQKKDVERRIEKAAKKDIYLYAFTLDVKQDRRARETLTAQIFRERSFHKGEVLMLITRTGVSAKAADVPDAQMSKYVQESVRYFQKSYGDGVEFLTDRITEEISGARSKQAAGRSFLLLVVFGIIAGIVLVVVSLRRKKTARFNAAYAEAVRMESEVLELFDMVRAKQKLSDDRRLNAQAEELDRRYTNAHDLLEKLKESGNKTDFQRAESIANLFRGLLTDLQRLRTGEEPAGYSATGGSSFGAEESGSRGPLDGNCFFCSNPVNSQTAEKAKISLGDQEQWVLMCQYCSDYHRRTGQMPKVLSRTYQGQPVHWKDDPSYTPPAQPQPMSQSMGGGFGGMSFLDLWLLSSIFNRPSHDRVIFVDRDSGGRHVSYDVDEQRARAAGSDYRHEASQDRTYDAAPSADFYEKDRS